MCKVSVLIPVYNASPYIERCLDSVLSQEYLSMEIIIVNDGSTDDSIHVIQQFILKHPERSDQVFIIDNKINSGSGATRREALLKASGDYVMWVDSDDWLEANVISKLVSAANESKADIIVADHYFVYPDRKTKGNSFQGQDKMDYIVRLLTKDNRISVALWGKLISRELHLLVLPEPGLDFGEDYAIIPKLVALSNQVYHLPIVIYNYFQGNQNSYVRKFTHSSFCNVIDAVESLDEFFTVFPNMPAEALKKMMMRNKAFLLRRAQGEDRIFAKKLWGSIKYNGKLPLLDRLTFAFASINAIPLLNWGYRVVSKRKKLLS